MKVVMPSGLSQDSLPDIVPMACYCGTAESFATANTDTGSGKDNCFHCGCGCDLIAHDATWGHAQTTIRTSSL